MTTYAFQGLAVTSDSNGNPLFIDTTSTLELVVPDSTTSLSYTLDPLFFDADVSLNAYTVRLNGVPFSATYAPDEVQLSDIDWIDPLPRSAIFAEMVFYTGLQMTSYGFVVAGDQLPPVQTPQELLDFVLNQLAFIADPSGAFGPNTVIPLSALDTATVTEDDLIQGTATADVFNGGLGNDLIFGLGGDDILAGGAGNDILVGGAGADGLDGGEGIDTARYDGATGRQVIDLFLTARSTGDAAGDTLSGIEILQGGDLSRDILGGTLGADTLDGAGSRDVLFGRGGDDTLLGGNGDDVLLGGTGADVIDGGSGTDRAQYAQARTGVTVDLLNSALNNGEAAGDTLISIEDLFGSGHDDVLSGNARANTLFGGSGNDRLTGRAGDDFLFGGAGADIMTGGSGDDRYSGGASQDTIIYTAGADVVEGWRLDRIRFDKDLWGGTDLSKAQILTFASVISGDTVFDFGSGNTLTVEAHTDLAALERWIDGF